MTGEKDGRHARLERNKTEVVQALLTLIREIGDVPTADMLAHRAGVSRRSVFRLFDDRAALLREAFDVMYQEVAEQFPFPDLPSLPLSERVQHLVDHLASIYEYITPFRRVSERLRADSPHIDRERKRVQSLYGKRIWEAFADVVGANGAASATIREAMQLVASWKAWDHLRTERGHSVTRAKAVMVHALTAVLQRGNR